METTPAEGTATSRAGFLRSAFVGGVFAIDTTGHCLAMAAICFTGVVSAGLGYGAVAFLLASFLGTLALVAFGKFRAPFAVAQDVSIAILAPAVAIAATSADLGGGGVAPVATAFAVLGTSAIASGVALWLVGRFRLGRLVRMFPYPVACGFLASSGVLLLMAGVGVIAEAAGTGPADRVDLLRNLGIAAALAATLVIAVRGGSGIYLFVTVMAAFLALYFAVTLTLGIDADAAVDMGLLPHLATTGSAGIEIGPHLLAAIDWRAVAGVTPILVTVVLVNVIGMALNTGGVEIGTRAEVDVDQEMRVTGAANVLIGTFGGITTFLQAGSTLIIHKLGVDPRSALIGYSGVALLAIWFGVAIAAAVPTVFVAGLLMFIGLSLIGDWLIGNLRRLPPGDVAVIIGIMALTLSVGILWAVATGLLFALVTFAATYARLPLVRRATDAAREPSPTDRTTSERALLRAEATGIRILYLRGALFFGSAEGLIDTMRAEQRRVGGLRGLILDVSEVSAFDTSVSGALVKLAYLSGDLDVGLHLTGMPDTVQRDLARWGLPMGIGAAAPDGGYHIWPSLDAAVAHCETVLLTRGGLSDEIRPMKDILSDLATGDGAIRDLAALMEPRDLAVGEVLIEAETIGRDLFVIEWGRLDTLLVTGGAAPTRVRSSGAGAVLGELALVLNAKRSARIVATAPSRVWCLTGTVIERLDAERPDLAALLTRILLRAVAGKLVQTNDLLAQARDRSDRIRD